MNKELEEAIKEIEEIKNLGTSGIVPRWKPIDILLKHVKNSVSKEVIEKKIKELKENLNVDDNIRIYTLKESYELQIEILQEILEEK